MLKPMFVERPLPQDGNDPEQGRARSVTVNLSESPLTWLHARGLLNDRQCATGELLRRDYEAAQLSANVTMRWDAPPLDGNRRGTADLAQSERSLAAKQRFHNAMTAAGPGLSDILWRIVCAGEAMALAEKSLGWPSRSGRLVLGLALDRLAGFYRVP